MIKPNRNHQDNKTSPLRTAKRNSARKSTTRLRRKMKQKKSVNCEVNSIISNEKDSDNQDNASTMANLTDVQGDIMESENTCSFPQNSAEEHLVTSKQPSQEDRDKNSTFCDNLQVRSSPLPQTNTQEDTFMTDSDMLDSFANTDGHEADVDTEDMGKIETSDVDDVHSAAKASMDNSVQTMDNSTLQIELPGDAEVTKNDAVEYQQPIPQVWLGEMSESTVATDEAVIGTESEFQEIDDSELEDVTVTVDEHFGNNAPTTLHSSRDTSQDTAIKHDDVDIVISDHSSAPAPSKEKSHRSSNLVAISVDSGEFTDVVENSVDLMSERNDMEGVNPSDHSVDDDDSDNGGEIIENHNLLDILDPGNDRHSVETDELLSDHHQGDSTDNPETSNTNANTVLDDGLPVRLNNSKSSNVSSQSNIVDLQDFSVDGSVRSYNAPAVFAASPAKILSDVADTVMKRPSKQEHLERVVQAKSVESPEQSYTVTDTREQPHPKPENNPFLSALEQVMTEADGHDSKSYQNSVGQDTEHIKFPEKTMQPFPEGINKNQDTATTPPTDVTGSPHENVSNEIQPTSQADDNGIHANKPTLSDDFLKSLEEELFSLNSFKEKPTENLDLDSKQLRRNTENQNTPNPSMERQQENLGKEEGINFDINKGESNIKDGTDPNSQDEKEFAVAALRNAMLDHETNVEPTKRKGKFRRFAKKLFSRKVLSSFFSMYLSFCLKFITLHLFIATTAKVEEKTKKKNC